MLTKPSALACSIKQAVYQGMACQLNTDAQNASAWTSYHTGLVYAQSHEAAKLPGKVTR